MRIQAIGAFCAPNFSKATVNKALSNTQNNDNNFKLPGYDISFGMSKAQINHHYSTLDHDTKEEIKEAVLDIEELDSNVETKFGHINMLVRKFQDDNNALKYIFEASNIQDTPEGASFAVAYLWALRENSDENEWSKGAKNKFFTNLLCESTNQTGYTIPQIFSKNALVLKNVFNVVDNHPDALYAILANTDSEGVSIGSHAAYSGDDELYKLLNEKIYYVAGQDKSIDTNDAIYLLGTNKDILDKTNGRLLKSFLNKDFSIS